MDRPQKQIVRPTRSRQRRPSGLPIGALVVTLAFAASMAALALASGGSLTVSAASNAKLGEQLTVDARGNTLYALSPETTHHLLCKSSQCLKFWPPLTVRSRKTKLTAGAGVHGHLGILRRPGGMLQVTLAGLPLYRFSGDHAKGEANGQGIHSFGGSWHVLPASTTPSAPTTQTEPASTPYPTPAPTPTPPPTQTTPTTPTTPTTTTTTPGYGY
jgi:predicted lipoprotein with Yx(FWY)xxD motif